MESYERCQNRIMALLFGSCQEEDWTMIPEGASVCTICSAIQAMERWVEYAQNLIRGEQGAADKPAEEENGCANKPPGPSS